MRLFASSLSLRRHTHGLLAKHLMHLAHKSGNTSGVSRLISDWLYYTGFLGDVCVAFFNVPPGNKYAVMPNALMKEDSSRVYNCDDVWYGNSLNQECKALQRVVRLAEHISGSALPSLQDIYLKRCKSRAAKILKDSNHPGNHLFCLLACSSGAWWQKLRLRRSFFPQAIRLLNTNSVS